QFVHALGGHRVQGNDEAKAKAIFEQALEIERLGCFALVLECIPHELSTQISKKLTIPAIGIGAGSGVDGQVLVAHDMLGLTDMRPKFLKHYLNGKELFKNALNNYCDEVKKGSFPQAGHSYY
ncbi:MAG: 3-methyl-2-oxobutanoate hydroxymethyltransferase, partial [spirochete symbiont of Stewartia floridana]